MIPWLINYGWLVENIHFAATSRTKASRMCGPFAPLLVASNDFPLNFLRVNSFQGTCSWLNLLRELSSMHHGRWPTVDPGPPTPGARWRCDRDALFGAGESAPWHVPWAASHGKPCQGALLTIVRGSPTATHRDPPEKSGITIWWWLMLKCRGHNCWERMGKVVDSWSLLQRRCCGWCRRVVVNCYWMQLIRIQPYEKQTLNQRMQADMVRSAVRLTSWKWCSRSSVRWLVWLCRESFPSAANECQWLYYHISIIDHHWWWLRLRSSMVSSSCFMFTKLAGGLYCETFS